MKNRTRKLALLLCLALLFTAAIGTTVAFWITGTDPIVNRFVSGLDPDGDLVIRKELTHPYGEGYAVPPELDFGFTVDLGESYAEKTVSTSRGDMTADESGVLTLSLRPGFEFEIYDLAEDTVVTVTETQYENDGFVVSGEEGAERTIEIARGANTVTFINDYDPALPAIALTGEKVLEGREWQVGESFTLLLEELTDKVWAPVEELSLTRQPEEIEDPENPGTMIPNPDYDPEYYLCEFDLSGYGFDRPGVWFFRVSEKTGEDGDLRYDEAVHYITVTLADEDMDGTLDGVVTLDGKAQEDTAAHVTFTNVYDPEPQGTAEAEILITKTLDDRSGREQGPEGFVFLLEDEDGNVIKSEPTNHDGETVIKLSYPASDAGRFYTYVLREDDSAGTPGMDYDDTEIELVVAVVDNGDGTASAVIFEKPAETEAPVETEAPAASEAPEATAEPVATEAPVTTEMPAEESTEVEEAAGLLAGLAELLDGAKKAPARRSAADVSSILEAVSDAVEESPAPADEPDETPVPTEEPEATAAPEETAEPEVTAEPETTATPEPTAIPAEDEDETTVYDIPEDASNTFRAAFKNTYALTGAKVTVTGEKEMTGREAEDGEFTFLMYPAALVNGEYVRDEDAEPYEAVNEDGAFAFETFTYDAIATEHFVVMEENGGRTIDGVRYDDGVFYVTVSVTDGGDGTLDADVSVYDRSGREAEICFRNEYKLAEKTVSIFGTKVLDGKPLKGEMFSFQLFAADGDFTVTGGEPIDTVTNDAAGEFAFDLTYDEPTTAYYVIREENGGETIDRLTYDGRAYGVAVSVTDNGDGTLDAEKTVTLLGGGETGGVLFENVFEGDTGIVVNIRKTVKLLGEESIGPEGFRFALTDADDPDNVTVYTTDAGGSASFRLSFTTEDIGKTFTYTLAEENDGREHVLYDDTVYELVIQVTEGEDGSAVALLNGEKTDSFTAAFENEYGISVTPVPTATPEPSATPETSATPVPTATASPSDMPQTGDENPIVLYIVILVVLAAALVVVLLTGKRKRRK